MVIPNCFVLLQKITANRNRTLECFNLLNFVKLLLSYHQKSF